jgi:hypothetical protein
MRPWAWGAIAALVAAAGFAPVVCVEGSSGGETTCNGLFLVPTNLALMAVMVVVAFSATALIIRRRHAGS